MQATRHNAAHLRQQVEQDLAHRVPGALSPRERLIRERVAVGIAALDELLGGGVPVGALTELVGPEGSGRTSMATALLASMTGAGGVCAWIDVADVLDPQSAAVAGIDLERLLWVRCGSGQEAGGSGQKKGFEANPTDTSGFPTNTAFSAGTDQPGPLARAPGGGCGSPHPRSEAKGMSEAVSALLQTQPRSGAGVSRRNRLIGTPSAPNRTLPQRSLQREEEADSDRQPPRRGEQLAKAMAARSENRQMALSKPAPSRIRAQERDPFCNEAKAGAPKRGWETLDQALRVTDLLLQAGGFGLLVLDLGSTPASMSWRIPLATWFRFRAACERTRTSLLILTQHPCARSSAELVLRLEPGRLEAQGVVLTGIRFRAGLERQRFGQITSNVVSIRKPAQREQAEPWGFGSGRPGQWKGRTAWAMEA